MKTTILIIFCSTALLFFVLILDSCAKCDKDVMRITEKKLSEIIPYSGSETLKFLHNNSDTQLFVGQGRERFIVDAPRAEDCPIPYEGYRIHFRNITTGENITVEYSYQNDAHYTAYSFGYKGKFISQSSGHIWGGLGTSLIVNAHEYYYITYYANSIDSANYFAICHPRINENARQLLIKIKFPGDTLTLIR
jgi:hypothetical protein